ncbi:MAG: hypothetical protein AAF514_09260 [Verrucomicrobiota bacterium]
MSASFFFFFFFGWTFLECAKTGGFWAIFRWNLLVALFAALGFLIWGFDLMYPGDGWKPGELIRFLIFAFSKEDTFGMGRFPEELSDKDLLRQTLFCVAATLIVGRSLFQLGLGRRRLFLLTAFFSLLVYPVFGQWKWGGGWLEQLGFYDFGGALVTWGCAGFFVLGARMAARSLTVVLPQEPLTRTLKQRFFHARGFGFIFVFFILQTAPIGGRNFFLSKTILVLSISISGLLAQLLLRFTLGKTRDQRLQYQGGFGLLAALVAMQACEGFEIPLIPVVTGLSILFGCLVLYAAHQEPVLADPCRSIASFATGGMIGTLMAGFSPLARFGPQAIGLIACILWAGGMGFLAMRVIRHARS